MNNVLQNSIQDAKNVDISKYSTGSNGSLSFSIVNSTDNGKRITFSKSLLKTLGADKTIELLISPQNKTVIVGVNLIALDENLNPCILTLRKGGIAYKSDIVKAISKILSVDFAKHTSYTFRDIEIIEESGTSVAIISVSNPIPKSCDDN